MRCWYYQDSIGTKVFFGRGIIEKSGYLNLQCCPFFYSLKDIPDFMKYVITNYCFYNNFFIGHCHTIFLTVEHILFKAKRMKKFLFFAFVVCLLSLVTKESNARDEQGRYVFAYVENGKYTDFTRHKDLIFERLDKLGFKDRYVMPEDLMFSPGWSSEQTIIEDIAEKVMARSDVDLIFSMGTAATKAFLAKNNHKTPIVGIAISDPYRSGIIKSKSESGTNNLTLLYIPNVWLSVFSSIYDIVGFKKIGIIYENTLNGRTYANFEDSIEAGRNLGFEVVEYPLYDPKSPYETCVRGVKYLIERGIDALFLSDIECFDSNIIDSRSVIAMANDKKIATVSNLGDLHVSAGALISVSSFSARSIGNFYAERIKKILEDNVVPADLSINAPFSPEIIINLETAQKIGVDVSMPILLGADKIYDSGVGQYEQGK